MYLMARGRAEPRCAVLKIVSKRSSTNFCSVPWGGGGGHAQPRPRSAGGGASEPDADPGEGSTASSQRLGEIAGINLSHPLPVSDSLVLSGWELG